VDVADYVSATGEQHLTSRDERAIWYNAGIRVRCTAVRRYLLGRLVSTYERYRVVGHSGTVVPLDDGGCAGGDYMTSIGEPTVAPMPGDSAVVPLCGDDGVVSGPGDDGGSYGGDDPAESTFPQKCGELGGHLYYDIITIVTWNEKTGTYQSWTGVAAICET
jgi:hypothetical protein